MARLAHEAYKVAWTAHYWARKDLEHASFKPTALDWETVYYLNQIVHQVPWVARDIERHPSTPRRSSMRSYDIVRFDTMMLKQRYQPTSFRRSTSPIEQLIRMLDEMDSYYQCPQSTRRDGDMLSCAPSARPQGST